MANVKKIEKDIKALEALLKMNDLDAADRKSVEGELEELKKELAEAKAAPSPAPKKKEEPKAPEKKRTFRVYGEEFSTNDDDCDLGKKLLKAYEKRKAVSDSTKKKTVPITKKIAGKIASAVATAIKDVPVQDIKDAPAQHIKKFEKLEKSAKEFVEDFKAVLGDDFKQSQIESEFKEVEKMISDLIKKYKK